jgi:hypothetical protein
MTTNRLISIPQNIGDAPQKTIIGSTYITDVTRPLPLTAHLVKMNQIPPVMQLHGIFQLQRHFFQ